MLLEHEGHRPSVDPSAYVAPTAVLSGDVRIGPESRILFNAVLTAEGGPVEVGRQCVVMEHAVLRGTARHPLRLADHVLVGPHAYLTGCELDDAVFVATGAMIFNGAKLGRASTVALGAAVHIGCRLPPETLVPIGWVAVGEPAEIHPPDRADAIRAGLTDAGGFMTYVFGADGGRPREETVRAALGRYSRSLGRHRDDVEIVRAELFRGEERP
jgi:carbonic anhydrase/acetyltransferase-like protein (isoleucine patch superfamily)